MVLHADSQLLAYATSRYQWNINESGQGIEVWIPQRMLLKQWYTRDSCHNANVSPRGCNNLKYVLPHRDHAHN